MSDAPLRYIAVIKLRPDITVEQRDAQLAKLDEVMARGPYSYRLARDLGLQPGTADYALIIDFESPRQLADWNAPSAEHAEMKRIAGATAEQVLVLSHVL